MLIIRRTSVTLAILLFILFSSVAQTSWKGTSSTAWNNAANWTAGVPNATIDAIIGDASFTGSFQPSTTAGAACKSLTIGGGVKAATLSMSKSLTVSGNITINSNGTISQGRCTIKLTGNWNNNGTYTNTNTSASVVFGGSAQTIGGTVTTPFRRLTINAGSTTTLIRNTAVSGRFTVSGIFNPGEGTTYQVTGAATLTVNNGGILKVLASTFGGNYSTTGTMTLNSGSIVDYAATTNQTVSNALTYATIRISGSGTKTLDGNLPALRSGISTDGNIYVLAGVLDLSTFTANRGTTSTGGTLSVAKDATLKIGGTNTFPINYATTTLNLTSTVEYAGAAQTVAAQTYGNLTLSSSAGGVTKTMPTTAFTVAGNLTSAIGAGTSVSYTAASNITVSGNLNIGAGTTFNGGSFIHNIAGNWANAGTFTGNASTVRFNATGAVLSGAGIQNFFNLESAGSNVTATAGTNLTVAGNFSTTGSGTFTHVPTGTFTMSGASKTISGTGIQFDNLTVSGTVTTASSFGISGNLTATGSLTASSGTITMSGTSKTITAGVLSLSGLSVSGSVTTTANFTISSLLSVSGSLTATAGTATFTNSSVLNGTANLYNVTINGTSLQLAANSVLGIANTYSITSGVLNVTAAVPNTVNFNGTGTQTVNAGTYHHLIVSNGNTKTAGGAVTTNGNLTIATGTTFNGSSFTHSIYGNWVNSGTFTSGTSTVQFLGTTDAQLSGATTFNVLTVNKSTTANGLTLLNNVNVPTVNMTNGWMRTGTNTLTITTTRTGPGIILGTIQRTHSFTTGTAYAFESPDNSVTFTAVSGVTSITVTITQGSIGDFPFGASVNRVYAISVPAGTYTATLRLHYEDAELNGNNETTMQLWRYSGSAWGVSGKLSNSATTNYVEHSGLTDITSRWTLSDNANVVVWNGSVSSDWNTAANWTATAGSPSRPPSSNDIVQLGTASFPVVNQPTISNAVTVKNIVFGSTQSTTLRLSTGGSLITNGSINGVWSANATHAINVGTQALTVGGDLALSDGTAGRAINLSIGTGTATIKGSLLQSGGNVEFTGAGTLGIGNNFTYSSGSFTAGTGTVVYNGTAAQSIAGVGYNHLTVNKTAGIASIAAATTIAGNLSVIAGQLELNSATTVNGNVSISTGASLNGGAVTTNVGGNWTNNGTFVPASSTINFNGTGAQTISASGFNNLTINKPAETATLTGAAPITGNLTVNTGTLNLNTYSADRVSFGGSVTLANGASLLVGGTNNFPANFASYSLGNTSTVHYNGTSTQVVGGVTYGNLLFSNGGANAKTLSASATVNGDITINSGASFNASASNINMYGNWTNNGSFVPSSSTILLYGSSKTITGNTTFNRLNVYGSYTVAGSDITFNGRLFITPTGSYAAGSGTATVNGDLTNSGILTSTGTTTFTGNVVQNIRLLGALVSNSSGIINFNGSVSPILNSTTTPTFVNLNINNTGGVNPSVNWDVLGNFSVGSGASFNGGASTHTFGGNVTNNGTITSTGTLQFNPSVAANAILTGTTFSSTGTVIFGGSGALTVTGTPTTLTNVIIANTTAVSPAAGWNMLGNFNINGGAVFNAGGHSYTVGGNLESTGTLNGGTSTFTMTSSAPGEISGSSGTTFHHFVVATGSSIATNSDINVAGNFTNNGVIDASIGALIMTGSSPATIGGATSPSTIAQLAIAKTAGSAATLAGNISAVADLQIISGTLDAGTYSIAQDATTGGLLTIDDGATLKIGGTNTLPTFSTLPAGTPAYALSKFSTVDYAGSSQTISPVTTYGNLTVSTSGVKTASAALTIQNNFSLANGTFTGGNYTHLIGGNWIMPSGTFTNTNTTIQLNGTGAQDIYTTGAFSNLTINKASGLTTLSNAATVNGVLALTSGKIDVGNNNLTIGSSGSITGASSSNYIITEQAGSLKQQVVSGVAKAFPIGFTNSYLPTTITPASGFVADNFSARLLTAAYTGGTSGTAVTSNAVNATWVINEDVAGSSNATVSLQWPGGLELSGFNRSLSRLARYTGTTWDYGTADISASGTNPYSVSRTGFSTFGAFAISSFKALPVSWLRVSGKNENRDNHISWATASEANNSYFVVEASTDGRTFTSLGMVKGATNSAAVQEYNYIHKQVNTNETFYRIKQVDIDGKYSYSKIIKVIIGATQEATIRLLSNPVKDQAIVLLNLNRNQQTVFVVNDASGKIVYQKVLLLNMGTSTVYIDASQWQGGMYFMSVSKENGEKSILPFLKK